MSTENIIQRLNDIYNLAEDHEDIRSMIKISELLYKIENSNKPKIRVEDIPIDKMEEIISYLEKNLEPPKADN